MDRANELVFPGGAWDGATDYIGIVGYPSKRLSSQEVLAINEKISVTAQQSFNSARKRKLFSLDPTCFKQVILSESDKCILKELPEQVQKSLNQSIELITNHISEYNNLLDLVYQLPPSSKAKELGMDHLYKMHTIVKESLATFKKQFKQVLSDQSHF